MRKDGAWKPRAVAAGAVSAVLLALAAALTVRLGRDGCAVMYFMPFAAWNASVLGMADIQKSTDGKS